MIVAEGRSIETPGPLEPRRRGQMGSIVIARRRDRTVPGHPPPIRPSHTGERHVERTRSTVHSRASWRPWPRVAWMWRLRQSSPGRPSRRVLDRIGHRSPGSSARGWPESGGGAPRSVRQEATTGCPRARPVLPGPHRPGASVSAARTAVTPAGPIAQRVSLVRGAGSATSRRRTARRPRTRRRP